MTTDVPAPGADPPTAAPAPASAPRAAPAVGGAAILAKLRAQREAKAATAAKKAARPLGVTFLFASQLGTAQEIAKALAAEAEQRGIHSKLASMNEFGFESLSAAAAPVVVMVASSTGDGDPPDNAARFFAAVRRRSNAKDALAGVQYTVLGLGDSNYTRFCAVPRTLRSRFGELGASEFYAGADADEVDGIEGVVDSWTAGLWAPLLAAVQPAGAAAAAEGGAAAPAPAAAAAPAAGPQGGPPLPRCRVLLEWVAAGSAEAEAVAAREAGRPTAEEQAVRDPAGQYSSEAPFWATVAAARPLTTPPSGDRQVLHLELDVAGSGIDYRPGDSVGVLSQNDPELVTGLVGRLGLDHGAVFHVRPAPEEGSGDGGGGSAAPALLPHLRSPCSVGAALAGGVDLTSPPRKSLLRLLAEHCADPGERARLLLLCSRDGREAYAKEILEARPSLLDLLRAYPSASPPLAALLDALPPLPARSYSVASSPRAAPTSVHVAFTVVQYSTAAGPRGGVATSWLQRLCQPLLSADSTPAVPAAAAELDGAGEVPIRVPLFLRRGGDFHPPADLSTPVIMIGPGTGVAPFRGFLQHRAAALAAAGAGAAPGACWLYFGCRHPEQDYLYREELEGYAASGVVDRLVVAFSRAQPHKVYVQHRMQEDAAALCDLILSQGAVVFVCGDGAAMAKDVHATLAGMLGREGGLGEAGGAARLAVLQAEKRYVRDIWS